MHGASKQELKNDLVKGDDKYPRTISNTINFYSTIAYAIEK